jgi:hypothetical protein
MNLSYNFFGNIRFPLIVFSYFLSLLLLDFSYSYFSISVSSPIVSIGFHGLQNLLFICFIYLLVSPFEAIHKISTWHFILVFFLLWLPHFLSSPLLTIDQDNLLLKMGCYFTAFLLFSVFYKGFSIKSLFLPLVFVWIPAVNLNLANGFTENWSLFYWLFKYNLYQVLLPTPAVLDIALAALKTLFHLTLAWLFLSIFSRKKRLTLELEQALPSKIFFVFVLKTVIYCLLSILVVTCLGLNSLPFFSNKLAWLLTAIGTFVFICVFIVFFRNTVLKSDNFKDENYIKPFLMFPFLDILALLFILFFNRKFNKYRIKPRFVKFLFSCFLLLAAAWSYFENIQGLPETEVKLKYTLLLFKFLIPSLLILGLFLKRGTKIFNFFLLSIFSISLPLIPVFFVQNLENSGDIQLISSVIHIYFQIICIWFFLKDYASNLIRDINPKAQ